MTAQRALRRGGQDDGVILHGATSANNPIELANER